MKHCLFVGKVSLVRLIFVVMIGVCGWMRDGWGASKSVKKMSINEEIKSLKKELDKSVEKTDISVQKVSERELEISEKFLELQDRLENKIFKEKEMSGLETFFTKGTTVKRLEKKREKQQKKVDELITQINKREDEKKLDLNVKQIGYSDKVKKNEFKDINESRAYFLRTPVEEMSIKGLDKILVNSDFIKQASYGSIKKLNDLSSSQGIPVNLKSEFEKIVKDEASSNFKKVYGEKLEKMSDDAYLWTPDGRIEALNKLDLNGFQELVNDPNMVFLSPGHKRAVLAALENMHFFEKIDSKTQRRVLEISMDPEVFWMEGASHKENFRHAIKTIDRLFTIKEPAEMERIWKESGLENKMGSFFKNAVSDAHGVKKTQLITVLNAWKRNLENRQSRGRQSNTGYLEGKLKDSKVRDRLVMTGLISALIASFIGTVFAIKDVVDKKK